MASGFNAALWQDPRLWADPAPLEPGVFHRTMFKHRIQTIWIWIWSCETVNRDGSLILWMTGAEQTLKLSNKRPGSSSPSPPSMSPTKKRRGAHYVTHQPSQSLTGSHLKEWTGFGGLVLRGGSRGPQRLVYHNKGRTREKQTKKRKRERESFPPTHSQLDGSHRPSCRPASPWKQCFSYWTSVLLTGRENFFFFLKLYLQQENCSFSSGLSQSCFLTTRLLPLLLFFWLFPWKQQNLLKRFLQFVTEEKTESLSLWGGGGDWVHCPCSVSQCVVCCSQLSFMLFTQFSFLQVQFLRAQVGFRDWFIVIWFSRSPAEDLIFRSSPDSLIHMDRLDASVSTGPAASSSWALLSSDLRPLCPVCGINVSVNTYENEMKTNTS